MGRRVAVVPWVLALIAAAASVNILLSQQKPGRVLANVGIVLVFAAFGFLIYPGIRGKHE